MPRSRKSRYAPEYRKFLDLLTRLRADSKVTQVQLEDRTGTSQSMLSKLERGVVRMDIMDLLDYLNGIEVDPVEFLKQFLAEIDWKPKPMAKGSVRSKPRA